MSQQFWATLAVTAVLAIAVAVGRSMAQTRADVIDLERLLKATRRLNDKLVAATKKESPSVEVAKAPKHSEHASWLRSKRIGWFDR